FFFQAEDGIRDFHVTGVQTCALPISHGASAACTGAAPSVGPCHAPPPWGPPEVGRSPAAPLPSDAGTGEHPSTRQHRPRHRIREIGRASCRERVWSSVVAVEIEKKSA